jgi:hypothetical protein
MSHDTNLIPATRNDIEASLAGGRWEFLLGPGVTCTMDVESVIDGYALGDRHSLNASHSADRARHGEWVMVNLRHALTITDRGER